MARFSLDRVVVNRSTASDATIGLVFVPSEDEWTIRCSSIHSHLPCVSNFHASMYRTDLASRAAPTQAGRSPRSHVRQGSPSLRYELDVRAKISSEHQRGMQLRHTFAVRYADEDGPPSNGDRTCCMRCRRHGAAVKMSCYTAARWSNTSCGTPVCAVY